MVGMLFPKQGHSVSQSHYCVACRSRRKTMNVWGGPYHSFILSGICPRDCLDNGKCVTQHGQLCWEGFSSLRCAYGMSELTPPLLLSTGEEIFYFTVSNQLQTMSGLLFRQWEWDAETHRGERRRTWTNPSTLHTKGAEFPLYAGFATSLLPPAHGLVEHLSVPSCAVDTTHTFPWHMERRVGLGSAGVLV